MEPHWRSEMSKPIYIFFGVAVLGVRIAWAQPVNLAPSGTASGSSQGWETIFGDANDGNRSGVFDAGSVWHSARETNRPPYFQIDLGNTFFLDRVQIFPRTDIRQHSLRNFQLSVLDAVGSEVWKSKYLPTSAANFAWGTSDLRGVRGRFVRLERLKDQPLFLTFAEFEVWGQSTAIGTNLALKKRVTSTDAGFGTVPGNANDGDIDGDYGHPGKPIYHSATSGIGTFWRVDLESTKELRYVQLFNRVDTNTAVAAGLTTEIELSVLDGNISPVFSTNINIARTVQTLGADQYGITVPLPAGTTGSHVKLATTADEYLVIGEVQVFGAATDGVPSSRP